MAGAVKHCGDGCSAVANFTSETQHDFPRRWQSYAPPKTMGTISALGSEQTLQRVAKGLNLVYWGIGIVLVSVLCTIVISIALQGSAEAAITLLILCTVGILLGIIVGFIGRVLCLAVPAKYLRTGVDLWGRCI